MSRLPNTGSDVGTWGTVLNDYLSVSHAADGSIKHIYNVKYPYGATGDGTTDDSTSIQNAINDCITAGGGTVFFPPGSYKIAAQITLGAHVQLAGVGPASKLLQAYWPGTFQGTIKATGTYTDSDITTLTANAAAGDSQLTVTSTSGISVGDYLLLGSDRAFSDATATNDNVRYRGEIVRVLSVPDSTHLNIYGFVQDDYATANSASVKGITYLSGVQIRNLAIENTAQGSHNSDFIYLLACRDFTIQDVYLRYSDNVGLHLDHCRDGVVKGAHMRDFTDDAGNARFGYGVLFNRCTENVTVSDSTFDRMRHAVTTNGVNNKRGVPRNITISNCTATHMTNAAFDTHNQGASILFTGCHANQCETAGYQIRSQDTKVIACSASYVNTGIIVGANGVGCEIRGSTFRHIVRKNSAGGYGAQISGINRVRMLNNTFDSCDRNFILIQDGTDDLVFRDNSCVNPGADNTSQSGIKVESGATCTNLRIIDNDMNAYASSQEEGRGLGVLNHAIDLTTTTTSSFVIGNRATNFSGNLVNNGSGTGNVIHSNNVTGSKDRIFAVSQGITGQNFDRAMASSTSLLTTNGTNGTLYLMLCPFMAGETITNIYFGISALATGMVTGKVGLANTAGLNLAVSSNQGTTWQSGTGSVGIQKTALTSPYTVSTDTSLYIQILCVAGNGTGITVYRQNSQGNINNAINSAARPYAAVATQTDITGTQTPGGSGALSIWVGWD